MIAQKARNYFLGKEGARFNCAQSVIAACRELFDLPNNAITVHANTGGGEAPNGYCGSLYAAIYILNQVNKEKIEECKNFFIANAGALTCKEIRSKRKISCANCVEVAVTFLGEIK